MAWPLSSVMMIFQVQAGPACAAAVARPRAVRRVTGPSQEMRPGWGEVPVRVRHGTSIRSRGPGIRRPGGMCAHPGAVGGLPLS